MRTAKWLVFFGIIIFSCATRAQIGYTLNISTNGDGTVYRDLELSSYAPNTTVILAAVPNPGFGFTGWSGDVSSGDNPLSLSMNTNKTIVANFISYPLLVNTNGSGMVYRDLELPGYAPGTTVILTAVPQLGYGFAGWSGAVTNNNNPLVLTMDEAKTITANFVSYPLALSTNGAGKIYRDLELDRYAPGTVVLLTAIPEPGYGFVGWSGDVTNSNNPLVLPMNGPKQITANFATVTLTVLTNNNGSVVRDLDQPGYPPNSIVLLTAVPDTGYHFVSWSGDIASTANPLRVQLKSNVTVTAQFDNRPRIQIWRDAWPPGTNTYQLTLFGRAGERYALESCTNFVQWNTIAELENSVGWVHFVYAAPATDGSETFFRANVLPNP